MRAGTRGDLSVNVHRCLTCWLVFPLAVHSRKKGCNSLSSSDLRSLHSSRTVITPRSRCVPSVETIFSFHPLAQLLQKLTIIHLHRWLVVDIYRVANPVWVSRRWGANIRSSISQSGCAFNVIHCISINQNCNSLDCGWFSKSFISLLFTCQVVIGQFNKAIILKVVV